MEICRVAPPAYSEMEAGIVDRLAGLSGGRGLICME